jgi:hypothetical protein
MTLRLLALVLLMTSVSGCAETNDAVNSSPAPLAPPILYHPPVKDAPLTRISHLPRGGSAQLPSIAVLMPEQIAYTTSEQPVLFWFVSKPTNVKCQISLQDVGRTPHQVIYETSLNGISSNGIQKLDLARENIRLRPGAMYQWLIALVPNPASPANNVDSGGLLQRMTPSEELSNKLTGKSPQDQAKEYAAAGFWFDALHVLSSAIETNPQDISLRQIRSSLLIQANLKEPAEFEQTH